MKPEPGKVFLESIRPGATAYLWDGREVRVEYVGAGGVTVSEAATREIFGKTVHSRKRTVLARQTNVTRHKPRGAA